MFSKIFRKHKKEKTIAPLPALDKLTEKLEFLEKKERVFEKKVATEIEKAKSLTRARNKREAIQCLKKKKLYEQEIEKLGNFKMRIHEQMMLLEGAEISFETVMALRTGASTMRAAQKEMKINDIEKTTTEINEQAEKMRQIQEIISTPIGAAADFDEDELEAELEELEDADLEEEKEVLQPVSKTPVTPARVVPAGEESSRRLPRLAEAEEDELVVLQAELAL